MKPAPQILIVEDDQALAEAVTVILKSRGYAVIHAKDGREGIRVAIDQPIDVILTDYRMPNLGGMDLLQHVRQTKPELPVIVATAFGTTDLAINATKHGAFEYLPKPFEMPDLLACIERALQATDSIIQKEVLADSLYGNHQTLIGQSKPMQEVFRDIGRIATTTVTVLIRGETGTGKELVARAIHQHSDRSEQPFIAVNCAAIPDTLLESELFGHEKGAVTRRIGRFEQAHRGTLFLDEIGDLPPQTQVKLLRVLQEKAVTRVGGHEELRIDVRFLCATHRHLKQMMVQGSFREDLYYRLNGTTITLPPLRDRTTDIKPLIRYFAQKHATELNRRQPEMTSEALEFLCNHRWPGNIRQLENVIRRAVIGANGFTITTKEIELLVHPPGDHDSHLETSDLANALSNLVRSKLEAAKNGELTNAYEHLVDDLERETMTRCLELADGNQSKMSRWLGISRLTVREKLDKFGLLPRRHYEN